MWLYLWARFDKGFAIYIMTDRHYLLADRVIKYMIDRPLSDKKAITEEFYSKQHCNLEDLHEVLAILQRDGIILPYPGRQMAFTLSNDGIRISEIGYKEFFRCKMERECINAKRESDQYRWTRQTLIISTLSLIVGLLSILISIIAMRR